MFERILVDPNVCHGKSVIKGTRIVASVVLGYLAKGSSVEQVIEDFPQVNKEDVLEAISFGSYLSNFESCLTI